MENKKKTVEDFIQQGEKLMDVPGSPKFLETHVTKLKEAWTLANEEALKRKNELADNLESWKNFEEKRVECSKMLDMADAELKSLRKNFNMERAPVELQEKVKGQDRQQGSDIPETPGNPRNPEGTTSTTLCLQ